MVQKNCPIRKIERNPPDRNDAFRLHAHKAVIVAIGALFLVVQQGCAHKLPDYSPQSIGKTALIVRTPAEKETLGILERGMHNKVGKGVAVGSSLGELGLVCGPGFIICMPALAIVGAIGGAAFGAATFAHQPMWNDAESVLRVALAELEIDKALARETVAYARANDYDIQVPPGGIGLEAKEAVPYEALAREGFGALLDISGTSVALVPVELTVIPPRQFIILANARLIRTDDKSVLVERIVSSDLGPPRPIEEWIADNAKAFREEVPPALQKLAEDIVTESFMLHRFSVQTVQGTMFDALVNGLLPVYPTLETGIRPYQPSEGDSLQPTLRWQPFDAGTVTYDLRIWGSIDSGRSRTIGEVVYSRERLVDTWHTLEAPLEPSSNYFWSVRSHFVQDGKHKVTEWSRYSLKPTKVTNILTMGISSFIPSAEVYYQFRTPSNPAENNKSGE
jgi:hypothetical protein